MMTVVSRRLLVTATVAALIVLPAVGIGPVAATHATFLSVIAASEEPASTGVIVEAGELVNFGAAGEWCMGGTPPTAECGTAAGIRSANPEEYPLVLDSAMLGELIGRVGSGPWFRIGASAQINMPNAGVLHLLFNDRPCCFGDNSGALTVTLSTAPGIPADPDNAEIARLLGLNGFCITALALATPAGPAAVALVIETYDPCAESLLTLARGGKQVYAVWKQCGPPSPTYACREVIRRYVAQ